MRIRLSLVLSLSLSSLIILAACGATGAPENTAAPPVVIEPAPTGVVESAVVETPAPELDAADESGSEASAAQPEQPATLRPWLASQLTDVRTGESFTLADFPGQVVIVEAMAVWCPLCDEQQAQIRVALDQLGDKAVAVSLDVDPGESADILAAHADQNGLAWRFVVASDELAQLLIDEYTPVIVSPPATPVILIGPDGAAERTPGGIKSSADLVAMVNSLLSQ
ncbi:MAG: peroxiredoxin family protein [Anaerolineales bacterium]